MSPHVLDLAKGSETSNDITDFVHYRIEECIQDYMSKEETANFIFDKFGVPHKFTRLIWYLLEKANPDFFSCFKTHCETIRNAPSEEVTSHAQTRQSNVEIETSLEDLAEASTSFTKPYNKPRAKRSKARKAKEKQEQQQQQRPIYPIRCLTETAPNDASSQVSQESATTNAGDAQNPLEKVSSKARRSKARKKVKQEKPQQAPCSPSTGTVQNVERAEASQESIPISDAETILKQISTRMRLLESIIEKVHKVLSNVLGPPRSAAKALKKQRSWKQVRGDYEQADHSMDLNQQVQQEMPRMDIPGNQASEEDTLHD
ncbi:hypothetical protein ISN45_Aa05g000670 [Arabidopsis thaliana x Arabidopsis arenosa]|uniref:Uncharacterized protein n=1 Tax=Arabidopsis thaliana x Arabidopsis arenosa TaxID=1240361 RepID=A0A8T1ZJ20_9BRAS|nr:hypothetical protein ISN45_Aa05g000670 [Arabidopsis thaliana x Arabidopsis arenosa]